MDPIAKAKTAPALSIGVWQRRFRATVMLFFGATLGACFQQPLPDLSHLPDAPVDFPTDTYQALLREGWQLWSLDPDQSLVQLRVYKAGRLARLGHNHIVSTRQIQGRVAVKEAQLQADLFVRLDQLELDRPDLRASAGEGFESAPDPEDVAGTRANMLSDKVMNAIQWPFATATISGELEPQDGAKWSVKLALRDQTRELVLPVEIEQQFDRLIVKGAITGLNLSAYGIPQFSVLGGAIAVGESVDLDFSIAAVNAD